MGSAASRCGNPGCGTLVCRPNAREFERVPMQPPVTPPASGWVPVLSAFKPLLPIPLLVVILTALWSFFRDTWKELDDDATEWPRRVGGRRAHGLSALRGARDVRRDPDAPGVLRRPRVLRRGHPALALPPRRAASEGHSLVEYDELYSFGWWVTSRVMGYVLPSPSGSWPSRKTRCSTWACASAASSSTRGSTAYFSRSCSPRCSSSRASRTSARTTRFTRAPRAPGSTFWPGRRCTSCSSSPSRCSSAASGSARCGAASGRGRSSRWPCPTA